MAPLRRFQISSAISAWTVALACVLPASAAEKITYDEHIFPIFESKCLNCHNPDKKKGDLDLSTYTGTMAGSSGGKIALAGDGGSSKLFTVTVHTEEPVMPPEGDKISKKNADLIRSWIDGGLLENKGSKARKPEKPAFDLGAIPTGKRPDGPPPMPQDLLLEPVISPQRATVVGDMDASPWAPLLAVTGQRQVLLYHTDTLDLIGVLPFPKGQPETLSFHPSGKYLLAGGGIAGKSGTTVTWDITTGKVMMTMGKEFDSVLAADLRADLGGVALGGPSRLVKLWDTQSVEQIQSIKKHTDWVTALAYSHDGVLLATGDRNNGVQIWEASTGNEFHSLRGHQGPIVDLKWRADSNLIASASEDDTIRFWDMNQGKEVKKTTVGGGGVLALDYAANGRLISASRDHRVRLWKPDLAKERESKPFPEMITEVAFSHDAARYFTADWNGKIEVWNSKDMKKVGELNAAPPQISDRLAVLEQAEASLGSGLIELRKNITTAQQALQAARDQLARTESTIAAEKAKTKNGKQGKDPAQQKIAIIKDRRQLAAEQQKLTKAHHAASQALVSLTRDTQKKREASLKAPTDQEKKADLIASEKSEGQQRETVQKLAVELSAHQKRIKEHAQAGKDDAKDEKDEKANLAKISTLQKQISPQRKIISEKEKIVKTAEAELKKVSTSGGDFEARIKKWQAAAINTELLQARAELAWLIRQKEDDPSLAPEIISLQKRCDDLQEEYRVAKN